MDLSPQAVYITVAATVGVVLFVLAITLVGFNWKKIDWDQFLEICVRAIFFVAYAAFLYASLHHIAYFFTSFEPTGTSPVGPYLLAIAFDATILILSIRISVGRKNLDNVAFGWICFFIAGLTAVSYLMNYEYAIQFQGIGLTRVPGWAQDINPWIASSFALLNIAYSIVARFFSGQKFDLVAYQEKLAERKNRLEAKHTHEEELKQVLGDIPPKQSLGQWIGATIGTAVSEINKRTRNVQSPVHIATPAQPTELVVPLPAPDPSLIVSQTDPELTLKNDEPITLGFIEQRMYEAIKDQPNMSELWSLSQTLGLQEFTVALQERFGDYASYITQERVEHILAYHRSQSHHIQKPEPITDPGIVTQPHLHVVPEPFDPTKLVNVVDGRPCMRTAQAAKVWEMSEPALKRYLGEHPGYAHTGYVGKTPYNLVDTEAEREAKESAKSKRTAKATSEQAS